MTEAELRAALARPVPVSERREIAASAEQGLAAAVLVPIILEPTPRILLTKRADHLRKHGGQVSFPGGRIDPGDASPEAAALREAWEEIALPPGAVDIIGRLSIIETGTGFLVTPVIGILAPGVPLHPAADEVAGLLTLPLAVLLDPDQPKRQRMKLKSGDWRDIWVWPHDDHYIWGATAAILLDLAKRLRDHR
ncbi:CoA pyrophosphatase [Acidisoma cellulosilytica]|uniref:CoA pyrophosphatase n=1 Tax=Acidisoma cellulosilyticum TaxID=2802395 RepID=A0A964E3Y8_9PROT|nr:CoA pyrophosphatase [Acidisoma cellulosilyticum]MCB8880727.1 CoA pyrophosphatase [Acidisoma cellulosilyticum]